MAIPLQPVPQEGFIGAGYKHANALAKENLENKYLPINTAVKVNNSLAYSGKGGQAALFLRSFAQLPSAEKSAYLSNKENRDHYMSMLEQQRQSNSNGGNAFSPEMMQQLVGGQGANNPLDALIPDFLKGNINQGQQNQRQQQEQPIAPSGQEFGADNRASPAEITDIANNGNGSDSSGVQVPANGPAVKLGNIDGTLVPEVGTGYTPEMAAADKSKQEEKPLSPQDRDLLGSQMRANDKSVGTKLKGRADNGLAFESLLKRMQPDIQKYVNDAAKYSGAYGRGKNWMDKFKQSQPEEYQNFIQLKNSIVPLLENGVIYLEGMSISPSSRHEAQNMISQFDKLDVSPETAVKNFNKTIKSLYQVSNGVLDVAEPLHPGVRRKLAGVPELKGDYVTYEGNKNPGAASPGHTVIDGQSFKKVNGKWVYA